MNVTFRTTDSIVETVIKVDEFTTIVRDLRDEDKTNYADAWNEFDESSASVTPAADTPTGS